MAPTSQLTIPYRLLPSLDSSPVGCLGQARLARQADAHMSWREELMQQKQNLDPLLQLSPAAMIITDLEEHVVAWNGAAERLFGYSAEEAAGRQVDELLSATDKLHPDMPSEAAEKNVVRTIVARTRKDGSLVDVELHAAPLVADKRRVGTFRVYHDITELQRQKRYFETLLEVSPTAIAVQDLDATVLSWNPAAERLFGYTAEEAIGHNLDDLVATRPDLHEEALAYNQAGRRRESIRAITRRNRKDGSLVDVELRVEPVLVGDEHIGLVVIYHDISELQQAREAAEAATEAKSAFLATMSHEIRTPLNAVIGMTGLLLDTGLSPEQRGYGEVIRSSGDALLAVINEILDFSKIEAGRLDLEREPFSVRHCVESALELVATSAAAKRLDLAYLIDPPTPHSIVGDVTRVRQILLNLLNNAVKFTDEGEVVLRVDARPLETGGGEGRYEIHFAVRDTGIGIPEDRMQSLFEAFSQADASTTRRYGGTGLGLAISRRLAEQMGGTLRGESAPGRGSTFHVTIAAEAAAGASIDELAGVPQLEGRRILIVDDNATDREILRRQAEAWGMEPVDTEFPAKALEWVARGGRFDVAILDVQMPGMDGLMLAAEIRRRRDGSQLPLVLLTSLGRTGPRETEIDFAAQLTKPIRPSQIRDVLVGIFAPELALQRFATTAAEAGEATPEWRPLRILVAEDNAVNQRVALLVLEKLGYRADVAGDGKEAIEALQRQPYDVILMDVQMPDMDGLEATREIRRRWPGPERRPRIVAMTAGATEDDRRACLAAGMDDFVSKPIRQEELTAALATSGTTSPASNPTIDGNALARLREAVGSEEALADLTRTFKADSNRLLAELRTDLHAGRSDDVRRHAHTLKSTAATFGAEALADLCRRLENLAGAESSERLNELVGDIEAEFGRVATALSHG
jgi:PAS domain S-box-containing protein